ncbi:PDR/VanB family oxidoreductase [Viridibacterium curvum]|uniref:PDR/VanB family oxidoreductase n=1 Tax=Viridibacterium curvum TaxID=1101404 RepID=A0ABP9QPI1_9RHOO
MTQTMIRATIRSIRIEADDIRSFELVSSDGTPLPAWQPGAHVQVALPGGPGKTLQRAYSLCNHVGEAGCYRIAVKREPASRGGSRAMHALQVGDSVEISAPRNLFELDPAAQRHVLIAGGIGITPLYAMFNALRGVAACELHYFVRSAAHAAFVDRLGDQIKLHAGLDANQTASALAAIVQPHASDSRTTFYTCGPAAFMAAVEAALTAAGIPLTQLRSERFGAEPQPASANEAGSGGSNKGEFRIVFARSGIEAEVPAGTPIIEVARACGVDIPTSCEQGVCGACLSDVLEGAPEHHDGYLSDAERASGRIMLPCVSRCVGTRLVLDR